MTTLYTAGYSTWPSANRMPRLLEAIQEVRVTTLIDVRLSPASSALDPANHYGPRPWTLQARGDGIAAHCASLSIRYLWLSELGNPQKNDPAHTLLRQHIADRESGWPVHRGLRLLADIVNSDEIVCLLCTCQDFDHCHRKEVAEALREMHFGGSLDIINLK